MSLPESHPRMTKRAFSLGELVADGVVHAVAILAGIIAFPALLLTVIERAAFGQLAALVIYAFGFFALFGFSLAYNMAPASPLKWLLRRFDHSSIYIMIAGTYTAFLAMMEPRPLTLALGGLIWAGAILGAVAKLVFPGRGDGLSLIAYLALGFVGVVAIGPMREALPGPSLVLLVAGGLTYVVGVVFYKWHRLRFHNAIWHLFVGAAAGLQFAAIALAVGA